MKQKVNTVEVGGLKNPPLTVTIPGGGTLCAVVVKQNGAEYRLRPPLELTGDDKTVIAKEFKEGGGNCFTICFS